MKIVRVFNKVFKEISFIGGQKKWLMSAEFEIK